MSLTRSNNFDINPKNLNDDELLEIVKELKKEIARANIENTWITRFLEQNSPMILKNAEIYLQSIQMEEKSATSTPDRRTFEISRGESMKSLRSVQSSSFKRSYSGRSTIASSSRTTRSTNLSFNINLSLKIDLCDKETMIIREEIEMNEKSNDKLMENLTSEINEIKLRDEDFKKIKEEFNNYIAQGKDYKTGQATAEMFVKFINKAESNGLRLADGMRLQTTTIGGKSKKIKDQLGKRQELSEILRPVDFEQMEIEKNQLLRSQIEKDKQYLGLRYSSAESSIALSLQQNKLMESIHEYNKLLARTKDGEKTVKKIMKDILSVEKEAKSLELANAKLLKNVETFKVPTVMQYIEKLNHEKEIIKQFKIVERKQYVTKIKFENEKQKYLKMKKNLHQATF